MEFVCVDVETANPDMASICQLGFVHFSDGEIVGEWCTYVDPEDYFDPMNVGIHGIDGDVVIGAPVLPQLGDYLASWLVGRAVVCHTHFDRVSLSQAYARYGMLMPQTTWLDSARVSRRTWEECRHSGYGLRPVCELIGYEFQHHDALEDAKAAGQIMLAAMVESGLSLDEWLVRVNQPIVPRDSTSDSFARDGNPEGDFFGEVVVFTGALEIPRREAADLAASVGCSVTDGVTKKTTMLVVGDQDVRRLAGHDKSSKHRKAEELIAAGRPIRILRESDFRALVAGAGGS